MSNSQQPSYLAHILADRLSLDEFQTLCFDLGVRYDDLGGEGISAKSRELVDRLQKRRALPDLRQALAKLRPDIALESKPADRMPYLGLHAFRETDADLFFGREALVETLVEKAKSTSFLAVLGASGSGKSSVVLAGLVPTLKGGALPGSGGRRYFTLTPGADPLRTLAATLAPALGGDLLESVAKLRRQLAANNEALLDVAALLPTGQGPRGRGGEGNARLVLVVDQFEELWTQAPTEAEAHKAFVAERQRPFIDLLLKAATSAAPGREPAVQVVITMRADFLGRAAEYPGLARWIGENDVIVSPMTPDDLRRAIERPALDVGGDFEPGLVDELVRAVAGQPGALPLLEYTLSQLWDAKRPDGVMTWEAYRALGGVEGALAARADAVLREKYTPDQQTELRGLLLRLVKPGEGAADTRRRVLLDDLVPAGQSEAAVRTLLHPLVDERLLTKGRDTATGGETVEVSHEALIRAWPTLERWIAEAREDLRLQIQLDDAAREWQANSENADYLWSGLRLARADEWLTRAEPALNARDRRFLDASREQEQAEAAAEEAALQHELELTRRAEEEQRLHAEAEKQRAEEGERAAHKLRQRLVMAGILAVLALVAAVGAVNGFTQARQQAQVALSRQLAAQSATEMESEPDLGFLLANEAYSIANTTEGRGALLGALQRTPALKSLLRGHSDHVTSVSFSPDGRTLASGSDDNTIILWDVAGPQPHPFGPPLRGKSGAVWSLAFSPDGKVVASGSKDNTITFWDVSNPQQPHALGQPLQGHSGYVRGLAFSPDGKTLASASGDKTIILWDVSNPEEPYSLTQPLQGHSSDVNTVAFSPDGKTLASGGDDGSIVLWDVSNLEQPLRLGQPLHVHSAYVVSIAFSPDGKTLASGSADRTVILWDVSNPQQPRESIQVLNAHSSSVLSVAFSPDGKTLASGGADRTIVLWDVSNPQQPRLRAQGFKGHSNYVSSVAFSPDGQTLASGSADNTVILWNVSDPQRPHAITSLLKGHSNSVLDVAFSPDGKTLASSSCATVDNGKCTKDEIILWDVSDSQHLYQLGPPLQGHSSEVNTVAFSPDGKTLASGSDDSIVLWDVSNREQPHGLGQPLHVHSAYVWSVAFSPDGKTLASASCTAVRDNRCTKGETVLWDVSSKEEPHQLDQPLQGDLDAISSVAFAPNGKLLASASCAASSFNECTSGQIILWDMANPQHPHQLGKPFQGHSSYITHVSFNANGQTLASAGVDQTIILWDVSDPEQPHALGPPLRGHSSSISRVAFSPDGKTLASGSDDNTIILWDVTNPQHPRPLGPPLQGHSDPVSSVVFSPDGKTLASGSWDKTIILWDVDVELWLVRACHIANRNLSLAEWNQYIGPETPYHKTCSDLPPGEGAPNQ